MIGVLALASALAPLLTPYNPNEGSLALTLAPMSRGHPLGADGVGRDVLARLLYGGRISLLGALLAVAIGLLIGVPFGIVSGYFRGRLDSAANWVGNIVLAAPAIIVLLVVMSSAGDSTYLAMVVFGVLPSAFRLTRSSGILCTRGALYRGGAARGGPERPADHASSRLSRCHST